MIKTEYFKIEESPYNPGKYSIAINFDKLPPMYTSGSYKILFARLMNLTYAQYIRMCRDVFGAEIIGKGALYPAIYFSKTRELVELVRLLNNRMNLVMWEREHPDWREHQDYLAQKEAAKNVSNTRNS